MLKIEKGPHSEKAAASPQIKREEQFFSRYANNVRFESTVHDIKLIFGQTDLETGKEVVVQHSAVTIPWSVVKVVLHFLRLNLSIHELYNGPVYVSPQQIPPPFPVPTEDQIKSDPLAEQASTMAKDLRDELLAALWQK